MYYNCTIFYLAWMSELLSITLGNSLICPKITPMELYLVKNPQSLVYLEERFYHFTGVRCYVLRKTTRSVITG